MATFLIIWRLLALAVGPIVFAKRIYPLSIDRGRQGDKVNQ